MRARWYYIFFAYLLAIVSIPPASYSTVLIPVSIVFLIALLFNSFLSYYLYKNNEESITEIKLWYLNVTQVAFDVIYIFFILVLSGIGLSSLVQTFFFLPIIISMMFFGWRGAIAVSAISSVFLFFVVFNDAGIVLAFLKNPSSIPRLYAASNMTLKLSQAGVMSLIYLFVGVLSGSVAKLLSHHEAELQKRFLEEESTVSKLSELTKDFELSSKLLVRRDIELTMANESMHELDLMKTEIISVAAHQLRSPLSGIKWMMKMMLDDDVGKFTKDQHDWLQRGYDANERLIKTVNDLLEVDRLESGRVKYIFAFADLNQLVEKSISGLLSKASLKNIHISFEKNLDISSLYLDSERIEDMLQNLIDNAIKYSKVNSVVVVTLKVVENVIRISINDTGIGIPEKDQKNIFSKFFRAQNATSFNTEGAGLGLSIAENVVLRHGGKIWFKSVENEGTTFFVDLPLSLRNLEK